MGQRHVDICGHFGLTLRCDALIIFTCGIWSNAHGELGEDDAIVTYVFLPDGHAHGKGVDERNAIVDPGLHDLAGRRCHEERLQA
eukprot:3400346-Pleurochrysis_carterae.AAC.1